MFKQNSEEFNLEIGHSTGVFTAQYMIGQYSKLLMATRTQMEDAVIDATEECDEKMDVFNM